MNPTRLLSMPPCRLPAALPRSWLLRDVNVNIPKLPEMLGEALPGGGVPGSLLALQGVLPSAALMASGSCSRLRRRRRCHKNSPQASAAAPTTASGTATAATGKLLPLEAVLFSLLLLLLLLLLLGKVHVIVVLVTLKPNSPTA